MEPTTDLSAGMAARLEEAREHRGLSKRHIARAIGIGETPLGRIFSGESQPSVANLTAIMRELKVRPTWVIVGTGPRYDEEAEGAAAPTDSGESGLHRAIAAAVDDWLGAHSTRLAITPEERDFMRSYPFPAKPHPMPDQVYEMTLGHYRATQLIASR